MAQEQVEGTIPAVLAAAAYPADACCRWRSACWSCFVVVLVARTVMPLKWGSTVGTPSTMSRSAGVAAA